MKRVITGERNGRSRVAHLGDVGPVESRGFRMRLMWGTDGLPLQVPTSAADPDPVKEFYPAVDGMRVVLIEFLPDGSDSAGGVLDDVLEADGFHRTDSQDIGWLISGELGLELEDESVVWLVPGDVIVQNGTRHKWRNRTSEPAVAGFVCLGAVRIDPPPEGEATTGAEGSPATRDD
jgi:hypothetical protein